MAADIIMSKTFYSPYLSSYTASWEPVGPDVAVIRLGAQVWWAEDQGVRERGIADPTLPVAPDATSVEQTTIVVEVVAPADD